MTHQLPELPYSYDSLEPVIDQKTMEIHHTKHHQAYIDKLNDALKDNKDLENKPLRELLENLDNLPNEIRTIVQNHGGGHFNHSLYWQILSPNPSTMPVSLKEKIENDFHSVEDFKKQFIDSGLKRFGSGWVWLSIDKEQLVVHSTPNQDTPFMEKKVPILGIDLWEHAYYLNYQNRRQEYLEKIFNIINWQKVSDLYLNI